ncbi:MAG: Protein lysine acetyltransferase Pat [Gammaproteobacteria bacterium]|nr:Protein lysine acetyltransferase Pat [Gammaproteobacteria bacterium]
MSTLNLERLFAPRSVAVIGATDRSRAVGEVVLRNVLAAGYEGSVFPVNPKHGRVQGRQAWPDVASLPVAPDLAIICTPAATVAGLIDALGRRGTKAAIVISAGFGETGTSPRQALLDAARPHGLRILGPNSVGLLSPRIRMNASIAHIAAEAGSLAFVDPQRW